MNWVDFIILTVVSYFTVKGIFKGFFVQLFDIAGFLLALVSAFIFYSPIAQLLTKYFNLPIIVANPVGFLLIWIVFESFFFTAASEVFKRHLTPVLDTHINKFFGFIPATVNALLFLSFLLLFTVSLPISPEVKRDIFDSKIGSILVNTASVFERPFTNIFGPLARQSLTFITVSPDTKECIQLKFTQNQTSIDFESEKKMFQLLNEERVKFAIQPLVFDQSLAQVGRSHSKDMFQKGYFCHYSQEGKDVSHRLEEASINYRAAGENLALAPDVTRAHTGLMNSEGHRRNILDPAFKRIGIGTIDGGIYGKMFTQVFTD